MVSGVADRTSREANLGAGYAESAQASRVIDYLGRNSSPAQITAAAFTPSRPIRVVGELVQPPRLGPQVTQDRVSDEPAGAGALMP